MDRQLQWQCILKVWKLCHPSFYFLSGCQPNGEKLCVWIVQVLLSIPRSPCSYIMSCDHAPSTHCFCVSVFLQCSSRCSAQPTWTCALSGGDIKGTDIQHVRDGPARGPLRCGLARLYLSILFDMLALHISIFMESPPKNH